MITLNEYAEKHLNPEARRLLAKILDVPVGSVTDDMVLRYIAELPEDED